MARLLFLTAAMTLLVLTPSAGSGALQLRQSVEDNVFFNAEIIGRDQPITGAPYTATAEIQNVQVLADGKNRIVRNATQFVARDSKGRIRREQDMDALGSLQLDGPKVVFITDPVSSKQYVLNTKLRTARVVKQPEVRILRPESNRESKPKADESDNESAAKREEGRRQLTGSKDSSEESLGEKMVEGLTAKGVLRKWTISPGTIGNEQPIDVSVEVWYSPELNIEVIRNRIDPRFGESHYRLTNIRRAEPDPALFRIPTGYRLVSAQ